jgi:Zn-dependent peptidase ImmA (M78 family)
VVWHVPFKSHLAPRPRRRSGSAPSPSIMEREAFEEAEGLLVEVVSGGLPVDPVPIAKALGIKVVLSSLGEEFSGALVKRTGQDPVIWINDGDSRNRQRFTVAHQLGHFVRLRDEVDAFGYVDFRRALLSGDIGEEESYANAFAAALLMPELAVRELHARRLGEVGMLMCFGVPREAMRYRWDSLGLS